MMLLNYVTNKEEVLDHIPKLMVRSITTFLNREKKKICTFICDWNARQQRSRIWFV